MKKGSPFRLSAYVIAPELWRRVAKLSKICTHVIIAEVAERGKISIEFRGTELA